MDRRQRQMCIRDGSYRREASAELGEVVGGLDTLELLIRLVFVCEKDPTSRSGGEGKGWGGGGMRGEEGEGRRECVEKRG